MKWREKQYFLETGGEDLEKSVKNEIVHLEVEKIKPNPFQPRQDFKEGEIEELSESIKAHGLIQPVVVRRGEGGFQLVAGERRLRAAKSAGKATIPAIVIEVDGIDVAEISLIENVQRKNLNAIEESDAYGILTKKFGITQEEISKRVGKSRSHVANTIRLSALSETIRDGLRNELISMGHGRALLALDDPMQQEEVYKKAVSDSLTVRQTEKIISDLKGKGVGRRTKKHKVTKVFADARIYFNAIKKVLKEIREAGGKADVVERETEDYMEIMVRIPKEGTAQTSGERK